MVAGVCAGLARSAGLDPLILRVAFAAGAIAGVGIPAYIVAWVAPPEDAAARPWRGAAQRARRGEVAFGVGLLVLAVLLTMRGLGLWFSDVVVWPAVLVGAGGALLWRQATSGRPWRAPAC